MLLLVLRLL